MAFNFGFLMASSSPVVQMSSAVTSAADNTVHDAVPHVDQQVLQEAINSAAQTTLSDVADTLHIDIGALGAPFGGITGSPGTEGLGGLAGSVGGIPLQDGIDSTQDLLNWAEGMMDPNRVDTGAGDGDPFQQPHQNGGLPDNVHINSGHGDGFILTGMGLDVGLKSIVKAATEPEHVFKDNAPLHASPYDGSKTTMTTHAQPFQPNLNDWLSTHGSHPKQKELLPGKLHPNPYKYEDGGDGGGIDGGTTPVFDQLFGPPDDDFRGDLGQVHLNFGNGASNGEGEPNASFEDLMAALGATPPAGTPAGEGGEGAGQDGGTDGGIVLPPYYVEHHANLIGAVVDPIPYII